MDISDQQADSSPEVAVYATVIGGKEKSRAIERTPAKVGYESSNSPPPEWADVEFVDWPFTDDAPSFEEHLAAVEKHRPEVAVPAPSVDTAAQLDPTGEAELSADVNGRGPHPCQDPDCGRVSNAATGWTYCDEHATAYAWQEELEDTEAQALREITNMDQQAATDGGTPNNDMTNSDMPLQEGDWTRTDDDPLTYEHDDGDLLRLEESGYGHSLWFVDEGNESFAHRIRFEEDDRDTLKRIMRDTLMREVRNVRGEHRTKHGGHNDIGLEKSDIVSRFYPLNGQPAQILAFHYHSMNELEEASNAELLDLDGIGQATVDQLREEVPEPEADDDPEPEPEADDGDDGDDHDFQVGDWVRHPDGEGEVTDLAPDAEGMVLTTATSSMDAEYLTRVDELEHAEQPDDRAQQKADHAKARSELVDRAESQFDAAADTLVEAAGVDRAKAETVLRDPGSGTLQSLYEAATDDPDSLTARKGIGDKTQAKLMDYLRQQYVPVDKRLEGAPEVGYFVHLDYADGGGMNATVTSVDGDEALVRVGKGAQPDRWDWRAGQLTDTNGKTHGVERVVVAERDATVYEEETEPGEPNTGYDVPDEDDLADALVARGINRITANHLADDHDSLDDVQQSVDSTDDLTDLKGVGDGSAGQVAEAFGAVEKADPPEADVDTSEMDQPVQDEFVADDADEPDESDDGPNWAAKKVLKNAWGRYKRVLKEGREAEKEVAEYQAARADGAEAAAEINEVRDAYGQEPIDFSGVDEIEGVEEVGGPLLPEDTDSGFEWDASGTYDPTEEFNDG